MQQAQAHIRGMQVQASGPLLLLAQYNLCGQSCAIGSRHRHGTRQSLTGSINLAKAGSFYVQARTVRHHVALLTGRHAGLHIATQAGLHDVTQHAIAFLCPVGCSCVQLDDVHIMKMQFPSTTPLFEHQPSAAVQVHDWIQ